MAQINVVLFKDRYIQCTIGKHTAKTYITVTFYMRNVKLKGQEKKLQTNKTPLVMYCSYSRGPFTTETYFMVKLHYSQYIHFDLVSKYLSLRGKHQTHWIKYCYGVDITLMYVLYLIYLYMYSVTSTKCLN